MVSAVSSASVALKVLQAGAPEQTASGQQEQDPLQRFLDPTSLVVLSPQSFDTLLTLRTELRRNPVQEPQAQPAYQAAPPASGADTPAQSGMLAVWANAPKVQRQSALDAWTERMKDIQAHPELVFGNTVPLSSPLSPWNSPDVIQQLKDKDRYGDDSDAPYRAFIASDAAIYKGMSETPPEDVAKIKAMGGEIWYDDSQFHERQSDKDFFRDMKNYYLYGGDLTDPIDPSDKASQALLNGTAQMIRGSSIPEFYDHYASYTMYAYNSNAGQYKWVGGFTTGENNISQIIEDLKKKNPNMNVTEQSADDEVAFILYPKTASTAPAATAIAQSSAAGTDTPPTATSAR